MTAKRQVHLAAHIPGVNNTTIWSGPDAGSQIDFESFEHFAANAEKGFFDYLLLAEGLRLREQKGLIHDLDVAGRPATLSILAAIAGVTEHIGLVGTLSSTFNEPYELAKQLASLDHLSGGRAGWNVVTSSNAFTGANFRRGGYLDLADRYVRAAEFVTTAKELWNSWADVAVVADKATGRFLDPEAIARVEHHGGQFDIEGYFSVPVSPQRHPVVVQAGDSVDGRDFAAQHAEVIFSRHSEFGEAKAFYDDVKGRLAAHGRDEESLRILPGATFVIGDSTADAQEKARATSLAQVSPQTAIAFVEQIWGRDLSGYDADGPLPDIEPSVDAEITRGRVRHENPLAVAKVWREKADAEHLSIRDLVIALSGRHSFVGTASDIASEIDHYVQDRATDGFVIVGATNPRGLDEFVAKVIPELQDRGSYRTAYDDGATLRENLGLPAVVPGATSLAREAVNQ
ncbi:F420-dependent methylene-tetrahydromethanopterin reductase [Frondihabitans sp. PAMC 28766]|uniref:NtaA/DmoA family FMN-dependent monooxygenase n=1 Tax=Frondihabitans sp. PAMC 28766 TaxID=1795630 RepID=UPI00078E19E9|nr:NtaA/DmoA family FMN-dependent monooxygenase [Frondihabitans sp. PAMC 28766]AMM21394.1 F420-dependent methylene-tetrahydromethanopterin reductase [Frondihabitans sp. PAMC 28766]